MKVLFALRVNSARSFRQPDMNEQSKRAIKSYRRRNNELVIHRNCIFYNIYFFSMSFFLIIFFLSRPARHAKVKAQKNLVKAFFFVCRLFGLTLSQQTLRALS